MTSPATTKTADDLEAAVDGEKVKERSLTAISIGEDSNKSQDTVIDPWDVVIEEDKSTKWKDLTSLGKLMRVCLNIGRIVLILACLYFFICSLDVLQDAFQMLSGRSAGNLFRNSVLVNNPVSATMIGVFVTVIVQSSSTSTSIIVSMVASGLLPVKQSIPIVMGANIGTTVTNTIVALTQSPDRDIFRRAFAGATVHDAFNWLTVIILLPLECATHYLFLLTELMTKDISPINKSGQPQFLKVITDPLTKMIIEIDKKVITAIAENKDRQKFPLAKYWSKEILDYYVQTFSYDEGYNEFIRVNQSTFTFNVKFYVDNSTNTSSLNYTAVNEYNSTKCKHIFVGTGLPGYMAEGACGAILLIGSLLVMTFCLIFLVKILNSLFKGPMTGIIRKALNADFPGYFSYFTGYVVMLVGLVITILFQSSSVFTSALTPLVGMGLITVERVYPLTLGSNIGTTVTSMLAAFTADADKLKYTIQIALCHLFFNISGIILFYPIPFTRVPIPIAKMLGNITAKYRWFAVFYLLTMFGCLPLLIFGLSIAGPIVFMSVGIPLVVLLLVVVVINIIQNKKPNWLPEKLQNWDFLPEPLHSLDPYDRLLSKCSCCRKCDKNKETAVDSSEPSTIFKVEEAEYKEAYLGVDNLSYDHSSTQAVYNGGFFFHMSENEYNSGQTSGSSSLSKRNEILDDPNLKSSNF